MWLLIQVFLKCVQKKSESRLVKFLLGLLIFSASSTYISGQPVMEEIKDLNAIQKVDMHKFRDHTRDVSPLNEEVHVPKPDGLASTKNPPVADERDLYHKFASKKVFSGFDEAERRPPRDAEKLHVSQNKESISRPEIEGEGDHNVAEGSKTRAKYKAEHKASIHAEGSCQISHDNVQPVNPPYQATQSFYPGDSSTPLSHRMHNYGYRGMIGLPHPPSPMALIFEDEQQAAIFCTSVQLYNRLSTLGYSPYYKFPNPWPQHQNINFDNTHSPQHFSHRYNYHNEIPQSISRPQYSGSK